jgi:hypothetical protein
MTESAIRRWLIGAIAALATSAAVADGNGIDTVYHPYVQPLEHDLELRLTHAHGQLDGQTWRAGYGQTLSDRLFAEAYLIAQGDDTGSLDVTGYEVETLWQLTEQGQYAADWALLGAFEHTHQGDNRDVSLMLIGERQWARLVGTLNASVSYEWGPGVHHEPETRLALQGRYRYSPRLEPAVEFFAAENLHALGPALLGTERLAPGRRLHWEAGFAVGLDHASPDLSLRGKLEYEF